MGGTGQCQDYQSEEEFTPAPARAPKRQSRRKTTNAVSQTPGTRRQVRRPKTGESIEPSGLDYPTEQRSPQGSPVKKRSPRKRMTMSTSTASRSTILELPPPAFAPQLCSTPEPARSPCSPLADITQAALNGKSPMATDLKDLMPDKPLHTRLDKPMDIVIRSRALPQAVRDEPVGPKSRIVLTYLVLNNFKSYAGRQEVGPFHSSFSSVVGPNGSGKSNVIDSLLFVFGFRASKMRQGKISALIHNSAGFPNLEFCEVEVHFQEVMELVGSH